MKIAALTLPLIQGNSQVIIPAGTFEAPNGSMRGQGPWVLNDLDGQTLANKINNNGIDIVVDYEHQSILSAENGKPAPAAGWLLKGGFIWVSGTGLVASAIRWTVDATEMIRDGEYRYLSPVFSYSSQGVPLSLISVALTNTPALTTLQELSILSVRKCNMTTDTIDNQPQENKQAEQVKDIPAVISAPPAPHVMQLAAASNHPMIAALTNQVAALGADNSKLRAEMATLQNQLTMSARDGIITAALSDGRLLPAMEKWAREISIENLSDYLIQAQPIAILTGANQTKGKKPEAETTNNSGLTHDELAVCNQMRIDPKQFLAQKTLDKEKENGRFIR